MMTAMRNDVPPDGPWRTHAAWRPRVLVDFDGVIHRYSRGWQDGTIYDPPIEGAFGALDAMLDHGYDVVIFSTRDATQIRLWLDEHHWPAMPRPQVTITNEKLPAVAMIDDRAIRFESWMQALTDLEDHYPIPD